MSTQLVRTLRFGLLGGIILGLVALIAIGVAVAVTLAGARPPASSNTLRSAAPASTITITVPDTSVQILPTDPSHRPAPAHEFVAVAVQLANTGQTPATYAVTDFALHDQEGNTLAADPAGSTLLGAAPLPAQGTLQPGERRSGEIVFEVPMSDHSAILLWRPEGATPAGTVSWRLTI